MKRNVLLFGLIMMVMGLFQSCDNDETINRYYPISWMPVVDSDGEMLKSTYLDGTELEFVVPFKVHNGNEVTSIELSTAIVDPTSGEVSQKTKVKEYASSDYEYVAEELHYKVDMSYTIPSDLLDKKVQLLADFYTQNGTSQERFVAEFQVVEFKNVIGGLPYFYMWNNGSWAAQGFEAEHSAGYSALNMVMNFYGFDPDNANFQNDMGGNIAVHDVDFVTWYYVTQLSSPIFAQTVDEVNEVYNTEAPWYGGPKVLKGTTTGTYEAIEEAINNGEPVIVHGNFRNVDYLHQIVLVGSNETEFMVLDPAGKWNGAVKGDYEKTETIGMYTKYLKADVYAAIGDDGEVHMNTPF
ncbi:C39 family peptidase [Carboxylicivirga sediminis]|uniref:C39 family peptidase n=1 Tax=Carboxylicivirga sediminis TaxID=2006564 RepID=A0A941EXV3_9BACT|nr:C39 family peptidase [Carboxylicivirga sediminis]MBR8533988.1 C39 family peptidase [Carboxylicivirga sediminis]